MTGWYVERMPDRSAKVVIATTLLALLLVAAVPVALEAWTAAGIYPTFANAQLTVTSPRAEQR